MSVHAPATGQGGTVLLMVLVLLVATGALAETALRELSLQQRLVAGAMDHARARQAAHRGLQRALNELEEQVALGCADPGCGHPRRGTFELHPGHDWRAGAHHWWAENGSETDAGFHLIEAAGERPADDVGEPPWPLFRILVRGHGHRPGTTAVVAATCAVAPDGSGSHCPSFQALR